jgi:hypothetical protein
VHEKYFTIIFFPRTAMILDYSTDSSVGLQGHFIITLRKPETGTGMNRILFANGSRLALRNGDLRRHHAECRCMPSIKDDYTTLLPI